MEKITLKDFLKITIFTEVTAVFISLITWFILLFVGKQFPLFPVLFIMMGIVLLAIFIAVFIITPFANFIFKVYEQ